jgi:hypothetical protein
MGRLSIETFLRGASDFERAQYEILAQLQQIRLAFSQNEVFPHLAVLVDVYSNLKDLRDKSDGLRSATRGAIKGIDPEKQTVVYDDKHIEDLNLAAIEDLIDWSLPQIRTAIEEGTTICEFVESHLNLEEVGIMPSYVKEGYLIVPDEARRQSYVLRYELSIYQSSSEQFRTLKTTHVRSIPHSEIRPSPRSVKLLLIEENRDLPNPATFAFDSTIDFPYESTVLPVAKRKLMRHLYGRGGIA